MNRFLACFLVAFTSLTLAPAGGKELTDPDIRMAERRYDDAVARIYQDATKARATEAGKLLNVLRPALTAVTKAGELDRALAIRDKVKLYEAISAAGAPRPVEQVEFGGQSYALVKEHVTWHVAKRRCEAMGGYLACIETPEEDQFILRLCQGHDAWLGATDTENEGDWRWVTGHSLEYNNAGLDNFMGAQHHLFYWVAGGRWDDDFDGTRRFFICEWGR